jgi:hypothetical protein
VSASTRSALGFSAAVAALLIAGAALDPSGIFTWIGWTGSPVPALWWWAPYLVYAPVLLVLAFVGGRRAALGATRVSVFGQLWAVTLLATAAAELVYSIALIAPLYLQGRYVIPLAPTWAFLLWNTGYAALKMGLLGWLPALLGCWMFKPQRQQEQGRAWPAAIFVAGGTALLLAALGPWLSRYWWQASPLGYAYRLDATLFAPTPASGAGHALAALALLVVLIGWRLRRVASCGSAAIAAVQAVFVLFAVQGLAVWLQAGARAPDHDLWNVPALFVRAVDAASFALVAAVLAAAVALVVRRIRHAASVGGAMALLALGVAVFSAHDFKGVEPYLNAPTSRVERTETEDGAALPRLSVNAGQIVDERGAKLILRGFNVNQLGEYFLRDPKLPAVREISEQDFIDIAALGQNVVRLTLSWSRLEPQQGHVSQAYLERIRQALAWAKAHQVYVLLDLHQDAWGVHVDAPAGTQCRSGTDPMVGWDGAPAWATLTDGTPPCQVTGRDLAPNVSRAFQSFYMDRNGIQSSLVQAWTVLAQAFADDSTVVGYDLLNEPNFGESPPIASTLLLANYHARSIEAIRRGEAARAGGFQHIVFFEPSVIWSGFGIDNLPPRQFTPDTQTVFSPHLYNESISADQDFGLTLVSVERGYALAHAASQQLGTPLWIGEWGYFRSSEADAPLMKRQLAAEDALGIGSAFWVWKQSCSDPHAYPGKVAGNVRRISCPGLEELETATDITRPLSRPYLRRSPDANAQLKKTPTGVSVTGHYDAGERGCGMELWVPGDPKPEPTLAGGTLSDVTRIEPGAANLGPSGGWLVKACLAGNEGGGYRLDIR